MPRRITFSMVGGQRFSTQTLECAIAVLDNQTYARAVSLGKGVSFVLIKLIAKGRETLFPGTIFFHINGAYKVSATLASHQPTTCGQAGYDSTQRDLFKGG